jgi:hypothetical protein
LPVVSILDFIEKPDLAVSVIAAWLVKLSGDIFVTPLLESVIAGLSHFIDQ